MYIYIYIFVCVFVYAGNSVHYETLATIGDSLRFSVPHWCRMSSVNSIINTFGYLMYLPHLATDRGPSRDYIADLHWFSCRYCTLSWFIIAMTSYDMPWIEETIHFRRLPQTVLSSSKSLKFIAVILLKLKHEVRLNESKKIVSGVWCSLWSIWGTTITEKPPCTRKPEALWPSYWALTIECMELYCSSPKGKLKLNFCQFQ